MDIAERADLGIGRQMRHTALAAGNACGYNLIAGAILFLVGQPITINAWRNLGRLDLAASAPKDVGVRDRDIAAAQMPINCRLMIEEQSFVRAVRYSHDVDIPEFRAGFAPVAVG